MSEHEEFYYEPLTQDNIHEINELFVRSRGRGFPKGYFQKKCDNKYLNLPYMGGFACNKQGNKVSFFGIFPCMMKQGERTFLGGQTGNVITHPDYQRKGLFVFTGEHAIKEAKKNGVKLLYSRPNSNSYRGIEKLGFELTAFHNHYYIPVKCFPLNKIANKFPWFRKIYQFYVYVILLLFKRERVSISNSVIGSDNCGVFRDAGFLKHKKFEKNYFIKFCKVFLWFKIEDGLIVGDIDILNIESAKGYIRKLKLLCFLLGLHAVRFGISPDNLWDNILKQTYTPSKGFPILVKDLGAGIDASSVKLTAGDGNSF